MKDEEHAQKKEVADALLFGGFLALTAIVIGLAVTALA